MLETVHAVLAVGILLVVALFGIVAVTRISVAVGSVGLPLGLGLAVTVALVLLGVALRVRMSYELASQDLFRLDCARRSAAEREKARGEAGPYRTAPLAPVAPSTCVRCLFHDHEGEPVI